MKFFLDLKMKHKLICSFTLTLILALILGGGSIFSTQKLKNITEDYVHISIPAVDHLSDARESVMKLEKAALETALAKTPAELEAIENELLADRAAIDTSLAELLVIAPQFQAQVNEIHQLMDGVLTIRQQIMMESAKFTAEGNDAAYLLYKQSYEPAFNKVAAALNSLQTDVDQAIADRYTKASTVSYRAIIIVAILIILYFVCTAAAVLLLLRVIARPLEELEKAVVAMAEGRFSDAEVSYESNDELGILADSIRKIITKVKFIINDVVWYYTNVSQGNLDVMSKKPQEYTGDYEPILFTNRLLFADLTKIIGKFIMGVDKVNAGSEQVASGAQNLSQGATEQASTIQEITATMANLANQAKNNADLAEKAATAAGEAGNGIMESNKQMEKLMTAMNEITETSQEIGKIVKTIDDIAFQTNILALNAAVEAARAGAAGKGFAVVADEVRNLAAKSAEAAKSTTELIETTVSAIENGTTIAQETADSLNVVVTKALDVQEKITEIAKSAEEEAEACDQVSFGLEQVSVVVQNNSATSEESAAAAEELSYQAELLRAEVSHIKFRDNRYDVENIEDLQMILKADFAKMPQWQKDLIDSLRQHN